MNILMSVRHYSKETNKKQEKSWTWGTNMTFFTTVVALFLLYVGYKIVVGTLSGIASFFRGSSREKPMSDTFQPRIRVSYTGSDNYDGGYFQTTSNPKDKNAATAWVPKGKSVTVKGFEITDGLIYVGTKLKDESGWTVDPALINPTLPVKSDSIMLERADMGYWPSYSKIAPQCRAAHLTWLATGRCHPNIDIGYVFLYFYGLERRALVDTEYLPEAKSDLPVIRAEVKRLLALYGEHRSFHGYASAFLDILNLKIDGIDRIAPPPPDTSLTEVTTSLRVALGKLALDGEPIKVQWILPWIWQDREITKTSAMKRCKEEFNKLFILAFNQKYPKGMKISPNKTMLAANYRPASSGISAHQFPLEYNRQRIPNITLLQGPKNKLNELISGCSGQLEAYSRFIGRNPDARGSVASLALLPTPLLIENNDTTIKSLKNRLKEAIDQTGYGSLPGNFFFEFWPTANPEKMNKRETVTLVQLLSSLGYGFEPDPRFDAIAVTPQINTVIFDLPPTAPSSPSVEYKAACIMLRLASMVASADGDISQDEKAHIEKQADNYVGLYPEERIRLKAHMRFLFANPSKLSGLKKLVEDVTQAQQDAISRFLIDVVVADNRVDPSEVKALEKIYQALGLRNDDLYSQIHNASIYSPSSPARPLENAEPESGVSIDPALLAHKIKETAEVSAMLSSILGEEDITPKIPAAVAQAQKQISGLDEVHGNFLLKLGEQTKWAREELENIAEQLGIFIDGALDVINEFAYDHQGAPVIEDDGDTYFIDENVYRGVTA